MNQFAQLDRNYVWHPFTQMRDWLKREPIVIRSGQGAVLRDVRGREYLDANSSIWTNLHGHNHPKINAAIRRQSNKISHSSALGFANEPASLLAEKLVKAANSKSKIRNPKLSKVFFSDDGSTAVEVALKLAYEFTAAHARQEVASRNFFRSTARIMATRSARFQPATLIYFTRLTPACLFKTDNVMSPYCYRCPFNRAKPERADAREYRKCHWECVGLVGAKIFRAKKKGNPYAAFVFEPLMQGAAGMIPQPDGWLRQVAAIARASRRVAHRRRSDDGLWPGNQNSKSKSKCLCSPANKKMFSPISWPGQRHDRRLSADGRHADDAKNL